MFRRFLEGKHISLSIYIICTHGKNRTHFEILDERIEKSEVAFFIQNPQDTADLLKIRRRPEVVQALEDVFRNAETFVKSRVKVSFSRSLENHL